MTQAFRYFVKGIEIKGEAADATDNVEGSVFHNSTEQRLKTYIEGAVRELVTKDQSQTLSNKTLTSPVLNTGVSGTAVDIDGTLAANSDTKLASQKAIKTYIDTKTAAQNEASEITVTPAGTIAATNVQAALQELDTDIQNHLSDTTDAHDASAISNVPAGSIAATDVQAAINELDTDIQNHITDSADAHDASAISNVPSGNLVATDVQAALNELQGDIDTNTSGLSNHLSDASDAHDASAISVVPTGNLTATDVQAALNELQGDADASNTHIAASTNVHGVGVGNSVVGTGTSQVLTNKTITGADIRTPVRSDVKQDTKANLQTYALTASNGQLVFATDTKEMFQVVDTALVAVGGGGSGVGGTDILFAQTFEEAAITDFTQTGLSLSTSSPIHGAVSALMTHDSVANRSFKQVVAVDEKFRGQAMLLELNVKSTASAGNVTLNVYDETNVANIVASEQLTLSSATGGIKDFVAFTIPATCLNLSYTITALPEGGSPVTRIDDIICQLSSASLLETSVTVPVLAEGSYTPISNVTTNTTATGKYKQIGNTLELSLGLSYSGAPNAHSTMNIDIPSQYAIDPTFLAQSTSERQVVGYGRYFDPAGGTTPWVVQAVYLDTNTIRVNYVLQVSGASTIVYTQPITNTVPFAPTSGAYLSLNVTLPITAAATSDVTIPLTQSGIVQEADSEVILTSATVAAAANSIATGFVVSKITGDAFTTATNRVTVLKAGVYNITTSGDSANTTALQIFINGGAYAGHYSYAATGGGQSIPVAVSPLLKANDYIEVRQIGAASASSVRLSISYQGSLKQVTVNTNSKITIPTSELRFEGASARGAVATAIVKFDTMAKIRGDAFTVTNTANDGTYVTMTKAGKLSIGASLNMAANQLAIISKNQANLTLYPLASEALATLGNSTGAAAYQSMSWTGSVEVGDILRIGAIANPTSSIVNMLNLSFQEQEIQVSVSNTLPQFSESDSSVRVDTANGYGSTGTKIRRFSNVRENLGMDVEYVDSATNGASFTAKSAGVYNISYTESPSATAFIGLTKNSSSLATNITGLAFSEVLAMEYCDTATGVYNVSWQGALSAGDVIRPHTTGVSAVGYTSFTMSKVGKPNVTGVDVTPFVNVPQLVSQTAFIAGAGPISNTTIKTDISLSTGSGLFSQNTTTGIFTMLKAARVNLSFSGNANTATSVALTIAAGSKNAYGTTPAVSGAFTSCSLETDLALGDTFSFSVAANAVNTHAINITATATSDSILTAPETFSTDTAALTYAGSGTYTLSTLANAPVGTFITFTTAASSNTHTQTTTAPTQTTSSMNTDGIQIFARNFAALSTAASPARVAIQIGKGLKGTQLAMFKSTGKTTVGSMDYAVVSTTTAMGFAVKDYDEKTGVLMLDAATVNASANTTHEHNFSDGTQQTNGYIVVNASKNVSLTGMNIERVSAMVVNSAGTSISNGAAQTLVYDSAKYYDTHGALNTATGVFTVPETGYYQVSSAVRFQSNTYAVNNVVRIQLFKNGVIYAQSGGMAAQNTASTALGENLAVVVYASKGDLLRLDILNNRTAGATSLNTAAEQNYFSITKTNLGGK